MKRKELDFQLEGQPICRGVAIGTPFFFSLQDDSIPEFTIPEKDIEGEVKRYSRAVNNTKSDVKKLQHKLEKERITEGAAILDAHLQMMQDPSLTKGIEEQIRKTRKNAEFVFQTAINEYQKKFQSIADPFFRERFKDLYDISLRIMSHLRKSVRVSLADIPANSIVFSEYLTASDVAEANLESVAAFVTCSDGSTSHAAIVAKAKGIPYVTNVQFENLKAAQKKGIVVVDGREGKIVFCPSKKTVEVYEMIKKDFEKYFQTLAKNDKLKSETMDGYPIKISANIDMVNEIQAKQMKGCCGIGLFRSEYIFISNDSFPTEEEQYKIYQQLVKKSKGLPLVIRTFDFGGDKLTMSQHIPFEQNSFLGSRSLRFLLKEREIFKAQLRAILRANDQGNISIMFPMISALKELLDAKQLLEEARNELKDQGKKVQKMRIGCMIEVPSAAMIADLLAQECDFLSIGTNDLAQYSLAVDRRNHTEVDHNSSIDPSLLRMIKLVVREASDRGVPVTICGEIAADPRLTPVLLGLGVKELSMTPRFIPLVKQAVRSLTIIDAVNIAEKVLSLTSPKEISEFLAEEYCKLNAENQLY